MCYLLSFTMRSDIFTKPLVRFNIVVCTNMFYLDLHVSEVWRIFFFHLCDWSNNDKYFTYAKDFYNEQWNIARYCVDN